MAQPLLAEQFRELEPFVTTWALASHLERYEQSWVHPEQELQAFYQAMLPRVDEALKYLNQYTPEEMPEDARRLFHMLLALAHVSVAVEQGRNKGPGKYFDRKRCEPFSYERSRDRAGTPQNP